MASLLEGALKKQVAKAFKGRLSKGTLWRTTLAVDGLNDYGDADSNATVAFYKFEGIRDSFDASYAGRAGIPLTDVSILILLGTISVMPNQSDEIFIGLPFNKWYQIRRILEVDPAGASMKLQAYEIPGQS